mgnify:FL=1
MVKVITPSDSDLNIVNYTTGAGAYTTAVKIAALLGISDFTSSTSPTVAEVGDLMRRSEDFIDEFTNSSWRDNLVENEFHDFRASKGLRYHDYIGKIRLHREDIRKIIRIATWEGSNYTDIASVVATLKVNDFSNLTSIVLTGGGLTWTLSPHNTNAGNFNKLFGERTTAQEICYLINEQVPTNTAPFTKGTAKKTLQDGSSTYNISDFFYANLEDNEIITIVSLLPGSDGSSCTLTVNGGTNSRIQFTNREDYDRSSAWWDMKDMGDIFFRSEFPTYNKHSIKVTYTCGNTRVPAVIEDAATKLTACELIASDDSYVLLGSDSTNGIDLKSKYDSYKADVDKILRLKRRVVYYLDSD